MQPFSFKQEYQQYGPFFQTILMFLMTGKKQKQDQASEVFYQKNCS